VGTRLVTRANGKLSIAYIERLVRELADLRNQGHEIILVSSGAVGAGMGRLNLTKRPNAVRKKQACAAVGQGLLIHIYEKLFSEYGQVVAQILLTRGDLINRRRYINACNTLVTLLDWGVIPIINENDTVSVQEIKFGDNDRLSALVAGLCDANLLIILTDIDGLYKTNPHIDPQAAMIREVRQITAEIKGYAGNSREELATGGMITKLQAAEIAVNSGIGMIIANGKDPAVLNRIICGEKIGTYFHPVKRFLNRRKRWIAFGRVEQGKVAVDDGACNALCREGKSLLPVGITEVYGSFKKGELVVVVDRLGREIGRGLSNFSSAELCKIKQRHCAEIADRIGRHAADEVIHRDNLVIYNEEGQTLI
ncbi:MAG: glutamate 5-kinase, partial [Dethiobacter sp.]|nr:glutamate 5-kinase [Dethiobacter sp.]